MPSEPALPGAPALPVPALPGAPALLSDSVTAVPPQAQALSPRETRSDARSTFAFADRLVRLPMPRVEQGPRQRATSKN